MTRLGPEELARRTLRRQFPDMPGRGPDDVLALFDRLGPIQSQVPRAPFLAASSRLPGVAYDTVNGLFADHRLVKTSSLRGTVHTSTAATFPRLDAVARPLRATQARQILDLGRASPEEMYAEIERFCADDWRPRAEIVDHIRGWLVERGGAASTEAGAQAVIWGHSGLLRRPRDTHWERRTDAFHRTAGAVLPDLATYAPAAALRDLVLAHLRSYGPVTRADLVFFFGVRPGEVSEAVSAAGDAIESVAGEDGQTYLELADPPTDGTRDARVCACCPNSTACCSASPGPTGTGSAAPTSSARSGPRSTGCSLRSCCRTTGWSPSGARSPGGGGPISKSPCWAAAAPWPRTG